MPLPSRRWIDLTTEDFRALPADTVAILPTAAIEQHGPHLPVSVDTTINEGIVGRALALAPPDLPVLALPTLCIGKSDEHLHFPGTLAVDDRTLMDQWTHVGRSVARAGVRRMVILNSHGGQMQLIEVVARRLRIDAGMFVVSAHWPRLWGGDPRVSAAEERHGLHGGQMQLIEVVARRLRIDAGMFVVSAHWPRLWGGDPRVSAAEERHGLHGGQIETAMMLHLAPHLVRMEKAENFESWGVEIDRGNSILVPEGGVSFGWMAEDLHPSGATGDAARATADLGRDIVEAVAARLVTLVEEVRRLDIARLDAEWTRKRERLA
jgi:creatinine amidohydrolase